MSLAVPYLPYDQIGAKAQGALDTHHPTLTLPIPIESIVEFCYGIAVVPLPGLQANHEIDAFTSRSRKSIFVDQGVMEQRSPFRYRYSLAHEIGHIELHGSVHDQIQFSTIEEWKTAMRQIPERERSRLEFQAYDFAGVLLVPFEPLKERFDHWLRVLRRARIDLDRSIVDAAKPYLCTRLSREFKVSDKVIEKRLDKSGLWPPA